VNQDGETGLVVGLSHEGAGIVRAGKTVHVAGALPGETIRFRRARRHLTARGGLQFRTLPVKLCQA